MKGYAVIPLLILVAVAGFVSLSDETDATIINFEADGLHYWVFSEDDEVAFIGCDLDVEELNVPDHVTDPFGHVYTVSKALDCYVKAHVLNLPDTVTVIEGELFVGVYYTEAIHRDLSVGSGIVSVDLSDSCPLSKFTIRGKPSPLLESLDIPFKLDWTHNLSFENQSLHLDKAALASLGDGDNVFSMTLIDVHDVPKDTIGNNYVYRALKIQLGPDGQILDSKINVTFWGRNTDLLYVVTPDGTATKDYDRDTDTIHNHGRMVFNPCTIGVDRSGYILVCFEKETFLPMSNVMALAIALLGLVGGSVYYVLRIRKEENQENVLDSDDLETNIRSRQNTDTIVNGTLSLVMAVLPVLFLIIIYRIYSPDGIFTILLMNDSCVYVPLFIFEAILLEGIVLALYRRLEPHFKRDDGWRRALIDKGRGLGADTSEMESIDQEILSSQKLRMLIPGLAIMAVTMIIGSYALFFDMTGKYIFNSLLTIIFPPIMFILLMKGILVSPNRHEVLQSAFTDAMKRSFAEKGVFVDSMPVVTKSRTLWKQAILIVCTLGTYMVYLAGCGFREMNNHLRNQWAYENRLLGQLNGTIDIMGELDSAQAKKVMKKDKMPALLILAQLFTIAIAFDYFTKIVGTGLDVVMDVPGITIFGDITLEFLISMATILYDQIMVAFIIGALMGIQSKNIYSWRKVVINCITFSAPLLIGAFIYTGNGYSHLMDLNPLVTFAVTLDIMLMMILSVSIRKYYTPVNMNVERPSRWVKFVINGKDPYFNKKKEKKIDIKKIKR